MDITSSHDCPDDLRLAVKEVICDNDTERLKYEEALVAITVEESLNRLLSSAIALIDRSLCILQGSLTISDFYLVAIVNVYGGPIFGEESQNYWCVYIRHIFVCLVLHGVSKYKL